MEAAEKVTEEKTAVEAVSPVEILIPQDITNELLKILIADEKAALLLKGFFSGRDIKGNAILVGSFKILLNESGG